MQKERDLKRQQAQARKEAEAQARLLVLKVTFRFLPSKIFFSSL